MPFGDDNCIFPVLQIAYVEFCRTEETESGKWIEDTEQTTKLKANFVISAFGSQLNDQESMRELGITVPK